MCKILLLLRQVVFFQEIYEFPHLSQHTYLEQNDPISTLKTEICRKSSFQKLTLFSQGNNALDVAASNIDDFLWRDTCVFSTQLNRLTYSKQSLSPP
jgi:hypothetical protein